MTETPTPPATATEAERAPRLRVSVMKEIPRVAVYPPRGGPFVAGQEWLEEEIARIRALEDRSHDQEYLQKYLDALLLALQGFDAPQKEAP